MQISCCIPVVGRAYSDMPETTKLANTRPIKALNDPNAQTGAVQ